MPGGECRLEDPDGYVLMLAQIEAAAPAADRPQAAGVAVGRGAPMLRSAGLRMQARAMAVSSGPAPANRSVSEVTCSRLPAIAAEIVTGP
ncbi:hypothetical protein RLIN73S_03733 [Rhodanobacter lindaniclasticus]